MRRVALGFVFVFGFLCAGGFSAVVVAGTMTTHTTTTTTAPTGTTGATTAVVTTSTTTTTATAITTAPITTTTRPRPVRPAVLPPAVTVGNVPVGGLGPDAAYAAVRESFSRPLLIVIGKRKLEAAPGELGAVAYVRNAVQRARGARPGSDVPVAVVVRRGPLRAYVGRLAERFDREPVDSQLFLRALRPWLSKDRAGRRLERRAAVQTIARALATNERRPVRLTSRQVPAAVTRRNFGPVILIRRDLNRLYLYDGMRLKRTFAVATGQSVYPTPLGRFTIVVKWRHPWWYPPESPWADGLKPVPPGPGNPLGTRWMGLSAPGVGIHGTPDAASIGYSVSHGCIRMHIPEAEWLFERVDVGTTVFIVAA